MIQAMSIADWIRLFVALTICGVLLYNEPVLTKYVANWLPVADHFSFQYSLIRWGIVLISYIVSGHSPTTQTRHRNHVYLWRVDWLSVTQRAFGFSGFKLACVKSAIDTFSNRHFLLLAFTFFTLLHSVERNSSATTAINKRFAALFSLIIIIFGEGSVARARVWL